MPYIYLSIYLSFFFFLRFCSVQMLFVLFFVVGFFVHLRVDVFVYAPSVSVCLSVPVCLSVSLSLSVCARHVS